MIFCLKSLKKWAGSKILLTKKYYRFLSEFNEFISLSKDCDDHLTPIAKWSERYPVLSDWTSHTTFEPHYTYHPAWAARVLAKIKPSFHVDISSSLSFVSQISAFIPIHFYDYRPANLNLEGLSCMKADLLSLPFNTNSIESISCMHVIEHVGLGRYGDALDPQGDIKAIRELQRVTANNGHFLLVVPVGKPRVQFNAHRIYRASQLLELFKDDWKLNSFSLISDDASFIENAPITLSDSMSWACGCFWFTKSLT
ncbi:DUF268 domain-containing protein [Nodularia spumigena]|uniref:DUF268 domain-containing protein n=1 Tax=Nodularia spumigena UHCC 0060 TaxID=3110300 RepID=A0ABU5UXQ4_NODSP|nr:DUF268 domain-containing protein [Nodularia spumigena]MEA5526339.1 DUF268 domain-containing protein [Nodularia spumigena UHCC 0143]MEA5611101.1 DUF268 domain-containing protein [Nodularia spumigena UHCC 0060]MEA5612882.1 DUF268 domain-containing protein [Nodularia spumigena UHCC 0040]